MKAYLSFECIFIVLIIFLGLFACNPPIDKGPDETPPIIVTITPADGSTPVSVSTNIVIVFDESLDTSTIGTITLDGTTYTDGDNCVIAFSKTSSTNDTVTINTDNDFTNETLYSGMAVQGFKDESGNMMTAYNDVDYDFTTVDIGGGPVFNTTISGTITDQETGLPLFEAVVGAFDPETGGIITALTNADGNYSISIEHDGEFIFGVSMYGYGIYQEEITFTGNLIKDKET